MKGSVYHSIDFLTRVPQTLLSLLKAGPEGGHVTPQALTNNVVLFFNQVSLGFFLIQFLILLKLRDES